MLKSKARSYLRSLGNELTPVLIIGRGEVTPAVIEQADGVLETRELIKGRLLPQGAESRTAREIAGQIAEKTGAEVVQVIGNNFLLYRRSIKHPRIELPD